MTPVVGDALERTAMDEVAQVQFDPFDAAPLFQAFERWCVGRDPMWETPQWRTSQASWDALVEAMPAPVVSTPLYLIGAPAVIDDGVPFGEFRLERRVHQVSGVL